MSRTGSTWTRANAVSYTTQRAPASRLVLFAFTRLLKVSLESIGLAFRPKVGKNESRPDIYDLVNSACPDFPPTGASAMPRFRVLALFLALVALSVSAQSADTDWPM